MLRPPSSWEGGGRCASRLSLLLCLWAVPWVPTWAAAQQDLPPEKGPGARGWAEGALEVEPAAREFGDRYQFETVHAGFTVRNRGERVVFVEEALAVGGTGTVTIGQVLLAPGEETTVEVDQDLGSELGVTYFRYALITDEPGVERYRFSLSGFVESAYDPPTPTVSFGTVDAARGAVAESELGSREVQRLELLEVVEAPAWVRVTEAARAGVDGEALRLRFELEPGEAPPGLLGGAVLLRTNVPHQPQVSIVLRGAAYGIVVPNVNPVALGAVELGAAARSEVTLRARGGRVSLADLELDAPPPGISGDLHPCRPADAACRVLRLDFAPVAEGPLLHDLILRAPTLGETLTLHVYGIGLRPGAEIRELPLPPELAGEEGG